MKRSFPLLALLCLALAIFVTACQKADDSTESSLTVAQTCSECGRECPEGQMLCDECDGKVVEAGEEVVVQEFVPVEPAEPTYYADQPNTDLTGSSLSMSADGKSQTLTLPGNVKLEMRKIPAGSFTMGSPTSEPGRWSGNETQHEVTLTKDYWLGTFEVTQAQWQAVMGNNPSYFNGDDLPVGHVSWEDAKEFCEKLNNDSFVKKPKGYLFDLPTEAQWEYACRAGTATAYYGNVEGIAWYGGNSDGEIQPVGRKKPNAWGLYDMHGNVCEWCRDWFEDDYADDPEFLRRQASGSRRVCRGGCWNNPAELCRSAKRGGRSPDRQSHDLGFRLALVPVQ